jgi:hypothetical protein
MLQVEEGEGDGVGPLELLEAASQHLPLRTYPTSPMTYPHATHQPSIHSTNKRLQYQSVVGQRYVSPSHTCRQR